MPGYGRDSRRIGETIRNTGAGARGERSGVPVGTCFTVLHQPARDVAACRLLWCYFSMKSKFFCSISLCDCCFMCTDRVISIFSRKNLSISG